MTSTATGAIPKNQKLSKASEATANGEDEIGQFQIRPSLNQLFPEAKVKDIIVDVFQQVLEGTYQASEFQTIYFDCSKR